MTPHDPSEVHIVRTASLTLGIMGMLMNMLTFLGVLVHRDLTQRVKVLLLGLCCSNLGIIVPITCGAIALMIQTLDAGSVTNKSIMVVIVFSINATAIGVVLLAADRMHAVFRPTGYRVSSTSSERTVTLMAAGCCIAIGVTVINYHGGITGSDNYNPLEMFPDAGFAVFATYLFVCTVLVCCMYAAIARRLARSRRAVLPNIVHHPALLAPYDKGRNRRVTINTMILASWFCVTYLPIASYCIWLLGSGADRTREMQTARFVVMMVLPILNPIVDPFLYFWRLVSFKKSWNRCRQAVKRSNERLASSKGGDRSDNSVTLKWSAGAVTHM